MMWLHCRSANIDVRRRVGAVGRVFVYVWGGERG